ncbi:MAG: T9SS type A sorting domain-containing protein [Chitinophagaceae bacterium]|nr:T9SS type A sorting domain-containing protein [Chitinophagaceae bacterium]
MKKLLKPISLVVLFQFFALFAAGQFTCLFSDTAQYNLPDDAKELYASKNGWHLPANGTLRILFVFIEIDYDAGTDPNPNGTDEWPVNALPVWADNLLDPWIPTGQPNGLLTQYYQEASLGNYNLIGDYLVAPDNGGVFKILKSQASSVGHENAAINKVNQELNGNVVTANGLNSINYFDNWTKTTAGKPKITPSIDSPHKWDHIMFIWRNRLDGQGNPYNGTGNAAYWSIGTPLLGYLSDSYSNFGTFKSIPLAIARHEYAHLLYGHNNFHSAGGGWGAPSSYPYDYWIPLTGGWSVLGLSGSSLQTWNAWDRQRMDWKAPGNSFNISARNATNTTEVNGDLDATNANGTGIYTLRDFVTTGDAIRIKLPFTDPADEFPEFLWIENHTGTVNNGSPFDKWQYEEASCVEPFIAGMMAYIQIDKDTRESSNYNAVYGGYANYTRPLSADGRFDRSFESASTFNDCVQWGETWAFTEGLSNPLTGGCEEEHYTVDVDNNNVIGQSDQRLNFTEKINDTYYKHLFEFGATNHVFTLNGNNKIGISTNPSSSTSMNLVGQNTPVLSEKNLRKVYLNGVSVEIIACDANKNLQVQIRFDDVDIDRDIRWCADEIVLNPIATESGYSLNVKAGKTITLDQSLTATRMDNPIVFNGENVFADPTTFVVKPDAKINLEPNAKIQLKNNSTMHLNTASYCVVGNNGIIEVKSGTTFFLDDCGVLEINGNGKLIVRNGATLCISPNAILAFENGLQNLILETGVIIPVGYADPATIINNTLSNSSIITNTTWTSKNYFVNGSLTIEPQSTLIIQTSTLNFIDDNSYIIVKPGAKLILDGATLTNACSKPWQGIQVWGDKTAHQFPDANGNYQQGYLELNDATIENAVCAVDLWKPDDYGKTGGILKATNSHFINNVKSIHACYYTNKHPVTGQTISNVSFAKNCTFEINEAYNPALEFFKHVDLCHVNGIRFLGCDFLVSNVNGVSLYNQAIASYSASFKVDGYCNASIIPCPEVNYDHTTFTGFNWGIFATADLSLTNTFSVSHSIFNNNGTGIKMTAVKNASIYDNDFNIGPNLGDAYLCNTTSTSGFGIYSENSSGFSIEENLFQKANGAPTENYTGIYILNSQSADEIYKNTFNGLSYGNIAEGKNWLDVTLYQGLVYYCNENSGNYEDFRVGPIDSSGIQARQGDINHAAGNTFSSNAHYNFNNMGWYEIGYFYDINIPAAYPERVFHVTREGVNISNACSSHYGNNGSGVPDIVLTAEQMQQAESEYFMASSEYNDIKLLYDNLVDGGNTQALLADIENSYPEQMWTLYYELLARSPHLSREVLIAVADQTDVFPPSAIFDIMMANPDELKRYDMLTYLETKDDPLPDYMIAILSEVAEGTTYKTALQNQLAYYNHLMTRSANDILRSLLNDTITDLSQLRTWYENLGGLHSGEQIVATYMQEGNYTQALTIAEAFPNTYQLTEDELIEHDYYMDMLNLEISLAQQNQTIFDLDSTELAQVSFVASNSKSTAGSFARGILQYVFNQPSGQCLDLGSSGYKHSVAVDPERLSQARGMSAEFRPNPANTYVVLYYTLPLTETQGVLTITNAQGQQIESFILKGNEGQKLINIRHLKSGIYFYTLTSGNFLRSGKITIQR